MSSDILGRGFAFPLAISPSGGIAAAQQGQKIHDSIRVILGTRHGERLMRPTFGANLPSLVFAPNTQATADLARYYVEQALAAWEPRILLDEVTVTNDRGNNCLLINLRYRVKATYELQSMVYPFYLEAR